MDNKPIQWYKKILSWSFILLTSLSIYGQQAPSDWHVLHLKGRVKILSEMHYQRVDSNYAIRPGKLVDSTATYFDSAGKIIKYLIYDDRAKLKRIETRMYDSTGNLSQTLSQHATDTKGPWVTVYTYTPNGIRLRDSGYYMLFPNGERTISYYDKIGNHIWLKQYLPDGKLQFYSTYKYSAKERKFVETRYDAMGKISWTYVSFFDTGKRIIETRWYEKRKKLKGIDKFVYAEDGRVWKSFELASNGKLTHEYTYTRIIEAYGNWIFSIKSEGTTIISITARQIEYF